MALEALGQPTILLGTATFTSKARAELRSWGLPDTRYLEVPHHYQDLDEAKFAVLLGDLVRDINRLVGDPV